MSLFEMSGVTVLIWMYKTDLSDVQMTRRMSKVVNYSKYNIANYVSYCNKTITILRLYSQKTPFRPTKANDINIFTLDMPVILARSVAPICLPPASADPDQYADQNAVIMGWNATGYTK